MKTKQINDSFLRSIPNGKTPLISKRSLNILVLYEGGVSNWPLADIPETADGIECKLVRTRVSLPAYLDIAAYLELPSKMVSAI